MSRITTKPAIDRTKNQMELDLVTREQTGLQIQDIVLYIKQHADLAYMAKLQHRLDQCGDCFEQLSIVKKIEVKLNLATKLQQWADFLCNGSMFAAGIVYRLKREVLANGGTHPEVQVMAVEGLIVTTKGKMGLLMETRNFFSQV